ncbi:Carboxy-terminal kinesin 2 [Symbiodinium microadriaticum]|uniref:Carboxy-terminal kinesin 2 n=1 Tax=Symbiodinium microadriaticum TaxID=2951 RepID=A0A1Q9CX10_SYMMI|nr:Carboxy-terminal kinesin 2 [Symbiodinium microadriaticum]
MRLREYTFDRVFGWNPKGWTPPIWKFVKYAHVFAQSVGTCDQLPPSLAFSRVGPLSRLTLASRQKGLCALSRELQLLSYLLAPEPTFLGRLLRPRVPMPRIIPEMFTMNSDEDAGDGGDLPDEREDGAYQEPAVAREPVVEQAPDFHSRYFQGPTRTEFRCLRCDGDRWEVNLYGAWSDHVTLDRQTPRLDPEALQYHLEKAVWARSLGSDGEVEHLVHAAQQFERRGKRGLECFVANLLDFSKTFCVTLTTAVCLGMVPIEIYEVVSPNTGQSVRAPASIPTMRNADRRLWVERPDRGAPRQITRFAATRGSRRSEPSFHGDRAFGLPAKIHLRGGTSKTDLLRDLGHFDIYQTFVTYQWQDWRRRSVHCPGRLLIDDDGSKAEVRTLSCCLHMPYILPAVNNSQQHDFEQGTFKDDPAATAEIVQSEAVKTLRDLDETQKVPQLHRTGLLLLAVLSHAAKKLLNETSSTTTRLDGMDGDCQTGSWESALFDSAVYKTEAEPEPLQPEEIERLLPDNGDLYRCKHRDANKHHGESDTSDSGEWGQTRKKWHGLSATTFLQDDLSDTERELPLYWKTPLYYLVCTNVHGLSTAPRLWSLTVIKRLADLNYQHPIIIVYVDDFLGVYRSDYNVNEAIYEAVTFATSTKDNGFIMSDVPVKQSIIMTFSDASSANAENGRSQCGVQGLLCAPHVLEKTPAPCRWTGARANPNVLYNTVVPRNWIPTNLMWADGLTKHSQELQQSFHEWLQRPRVLLTVFAGTDHWEDGLSEGPVLRTVEIWRQRGIEVHLSASYVELFGSEVSDLLRDGQAAVLWDRADKAVMLQFVLQTASGTGRLLARAALELNFSSLEEVYELLQHGEVAKRRAATAMNERSTRAHTVFVLSLSVQRRQRLSCEGDLQLPARRSRFYFADLGGSEQLTKSKAPVTVVGGEEQYLPRICLGTKGLLLDQNIVVPGALAWLLKEYLPMRQGRLRELEVCEWMLLQEALGGSADALNFAESLQTLRFAETCAQAVSKAASITVALEKIEQDIKILQSEIARKVDSNSVGKRQHRKKQFQVVFLVNTSITRTSPGSTTSNVHPSLLPVSENSRPHRRTCFAEEERWETRLLRRRDLDTVAGEFGELGFQVHRRQMRNISYQGNSMTSTWEMQTNLAVAFDVKTDYRSMRDEATKGLRALLMEDVARTKAKDFEDEAVLAGALRLLFRSAKHAEDVPVHIFHGAEDPVVPLSTAQMGRARLEAAGLRTTFRAYAGMTHGVCDEEASAPVMSSQPPETLQISARLMRAGHSSLSRLRCWFHTRHPQNLFFIFGSVMLGALHNTSTVLRAHFSQHLSCSCSHTVGKLRRGSIRDTTEPAPHVRVADCVPLRLGAIHVRDSRRIASYCSEAEVAAFVEAEDCISPSADQVLAKLYMFAAFGFYDDKEALIKQIDSILQSDVLDPCTVGKLQGQPRRSPPKPLQFSSPGFEKKIKKKWFPCKVQIVMIEMVGPIVALKFFSSVVKGAEALLFIDSEAIEGALIKGYSSKEDVCKLVSAFWKVSSLSCESMLTANANLADWPSKGGPQSALVEQPVWPLVLRLGRYTDFPQLHPPRSVIAVGRRGIFLARLGHVGPLYILAGSLQGRDAELAKLVQECGLEAIAAAECAVLGCEKLKTLWPPSFADGSGRFVQNVTFEFHVPKCIKLVACP